MKKLAPDETLAIVRILRAGIDLCRTTHGLSYPDIAGGTVTSLSYHSEIGKFFRSVCRVTGRATPRATSKRVDTLHLRQGSTI